MSMHTTEISKTMAKATTQVLDGKTSPETAMALVAIARTEIVNWRARMEYARHKGKVATIAQME